MTKRYPFMEVDTSNSQLLTGNPCATLFDKDDMTEATVLAIPRNMKWFA